MREDKKSKDGEEKERKADRNVVKWRCKQHLPTRGQLFRMLRETGMKQLGSHKEAEQIRKSVYSILRQDQWERQPRRTQDIDR